MPEFLKLNKTALLRYYSVYVAIAEGPNETKLYVGKTGDNRKGCNPLISRIGNHFSYNKIHSQLPNKIEDHGEYEYCFFYENFFPYQDDMENNLGSLDTTNELERWLNEKIVILSKSFQNLKFLNPQRENLGFQSKKYKDSFQLREYEYGSKLDALVESVYNYLLSSKISKLDPKMSLLFLKPPKQYGFRGDVHLWKEMTFSLLDKPLPNDFLTVKSTISEHFLIITKHSMEAETFNLEKYNLGGMSEGKISTETWRQEFMDLFKVRFEEIRNE